MQAVQEAALQGPTSLIEAYSSDLHILDVLQESKQIASMTLEGLVSSPRNRPCPESSYH